MKITILCHNVRKGGGVHVCVELINTILAACKKKENLDIRLIVSEEISTYLSKSDGFRLDVLEHGGLFKRLRFELKIFISSFFCLPDVIFGLGNITMPFRARRRLILVHNPYYLIDWSEIRGLRLPIREVLKVFLQRSLFLLDSQCSGCIFVQSSHARKKLLTQKTFSTMDMKIKVLPNFRSEFKFTTNDKSEMHFRNEQHLRLLCLSAYYPHKNLEWLVEIVSEFNNLSDIQTLSLGLTFEIDCNRALQLQKRIDEIPNIKNLGQLNIYDKHFDFFRDWDAFISVSMLESWSGVMNDAVGLEAPIIVPEDWFFGPLGETAYKFKPNDKISFFETVEKLVDDIAKRKVKLPQFAVGYRDSMKGMLDEILK